VPDGPVEAGAAPNCAARARTGWRQGSAIGPADVVVLAVPGGAVAGVVREHAQALGGKLVVDCANNIGGGPAGSHDMITSAAPGVR
jgi:predicted dinucleotide-binding enzyme